MEASLRFYVDLLRFKNAEWGGPDFTCVTREDACIYLCLQDQGRGGAWVWVGVEDAEILHDELKARGVAIRRGRREPFMGTRVSSGRPGWECIALRFRTEVRTEARVLFEAH